MKYWAAQPLNIGESERAFIDTFDELAESGAALKKLGGKGSGVAEFHLPGGDVRNIIRIKKISQTPPVYPRNGGKIAKSPLK